MLKSSNEDIQEIKTFLEKENGKEFRWE